MDKNKRHSLTIRIQPRNETKLAKVVQWLNSLPREERRKKIIDVCMMTLLPYALEASQEHPAIVERCYWDAQERLFQYSYLMKQALSIDSEPPSSNVLGIKVFGKEVQKRELKESPRQTSLELGSDPEDDYLDLDVTFGV